MKANGTKHAPTLHEKVVEVQLTCSFSWGNVTDNAISTEVNVDKHSGNALRVRKTLMPKDSGLRVKELCTILSEFYSWHIDNTLSTPTKGRRLLPAAFHFLYMEKLGDAKAKAEEALDEVVAHYDDDVRAAKALLGGAAKDEDYPPAEDIRGYYNCDVRFFPLPTGDRILNVLGAEVAADVDSYVDAMAQAAVEDAKGKLREAVGRMAERLATPDGIFRNTLTENVDDVLNVLRYMNITEDAEFATIIDEAKDTLHGWNPEQLRKNPAVRSQVAKAAQQILAKL